MRTENEYNWKRFYNKPCWFCRMSAGIKSLLFALRILVNRLRSFKIWRTYFIGSNAPDFSSYEIIRKQWFVAPFSHLKWPKTKYRHIRALDKETLEALVA